jgi:hypothetical protein
MDASDYTIILTGIGVILAVIGCNATLFSWLRSDIALMKSESSADRRDMLQLIREIQFEMKDFHGRLERIDAEFKGRMDKSDAEFKSYLMYQHDFRKKEFQ